MVQHTPPEIHGRSATGPSVWTMGDLVDMEVLVHEDTLAAADGADALRARDREIHHAFLAGNSGARGRREAFRFWLEARRKERFPGGTSPGEEIRSYVFLAASLLFVAGLLVAAGAVASFFHGAEASAERPEPINVLAFGLVCIAFPFAVSLYGIWVAMGQKAFPRLPKAPAFFRGALFGLLKPLLNSVAARTSAGLGAGRRLDARTLAGALKQRAVSRKSAISAKFFLLAQTFGIAFTLGLPVFARVDYEFHSRVFGWQTTDREITAESVYSAVKSVAAPWGWFEGEGTGFPTAAQVEQTRFVRFQDPSHFPPDAAPAWANFLFWAALVYGLAPRLFLAWLSNRHAKAALRDEDFEELRFDALWERMTLSPVLFGRPDGNAALDEGAVGARGSLLAGADAEAARCTIIIPSEIHTPALMAAIEKWLKENKGWETAGAMALGSGPAEKERVVRALAASRSGEAPCRVLVVHESFMPLVEETTLFLRDIRAAIGGRGAVLVCLLGKPDGTPLAKPPTRTEAGIWKKKVVSLGDPNMDTLTFLAPE